jgi:RNA polymerase sigma factor (sigma-70 family)
MFPSGLYYNWAYCMSHKSDMELVTAIQKGDILSYEELVKRYQRGIFVFVVRLIRDEHTASDIVQETFIKTYQHIDRIDTTKKFSTYIFEIAKNTAFSYLRKLKQHISLDDIVNVGEEESFIEEIYRWDVIHCVRTAVSALPQKYRQVISLYYFEELSYEEISKKLSLPINTVRTHLKRAKNILKKELPYDK